MHPQWELLMALDLIRRYQAQVKKLGFHICLAGGVLNKGWSEKDLDLVFLPLTNLGKPDLAPLQAWLQQTWGDTQPNMTDSCPCDSLRFQASYRLEGVGTGRIDVFVV